MSIWESFADFLWNLFNSLWLFNLGFQEFNQFIEYTWNLISTNPFEYSSISGVVIFDVIAGYVNDAVKIVASSILIIVWLIGVLRTASRLGSPTHDPMDIFMKFIRLVIAEALIMSYEWFIRIIFDLASALISSFSLPPITSGSFLFPQLDPLAELSTLYTTYFNYGTGTGGLGVVLVMFILALAYIVNVTIVGIKLVTTVWGRFLRIFVVVLIAPIALAFYGSEKTEHNATKYLEGVGSIALQGVVIAIVMIAYIVFVQNIGGQIDFGILPLSSVDGYAGFSYVLMWAVKQFFLVNLLLALISASDQLAERYL